MEYLLAKRVLPASKFYRLSRNARRQAFTASRIAAFHVIEKVHQSIVLAGKEGHSFRKWASGLGPVFDKAGITGLSDHYLRILFQNSIMGAFNEAKNEIYAQTDPEEFPLREFHTVEDERVRSSHAKLNGFIAGRDDRIWKRLSPPLDHGCRCTTSMVHKNEDVKPSKKKLTISGRGFGFVSGSRRRRPVAPRIPKAPKVKLPADDATSGIPVSRSLKIPRRGAAHQVFSAVLQAIDDTHDDGRLSAIPVKVNRSKRALGQYQYRIDSGAAVKINVSSLGNQQHMTLAHEVGHFLDHHGIGRSGVFASSAGLLDDFLKAVKGSKAYQSILERIDNPKITVTETFFYLADRRYIKYLLDETELWARAYAQYIAVRSKNPLMLKELQQELASIRESPGKIFTQWEEKDFEPIAKEIDEIFKKLGWLK